MNTNTSSRGFLETFSNRLRLAQGGVIVFVVLAIGFVYLQTRSHSRVAGDNPRAFFTVDDGKTWFTDSSSNVAPFVKDGKQAVQAFVFRCGTGTAFVGYLQRFTPEAKQALEQNRSTPGAPDTGDATAVHTAFMTGREVKRPDDPDWVNTADHLKAAHIISATCPDGGVPEPVEP